MKRGEKREVGDGEGIELFNRAAAEPLRPWRGTGVALVMVSAADFWGRGEVLGWRMESRRRPNYRVLAGGCLSDKSYPVPTAVVLGGYCDSCHRH